MSDLVPEPTPPTSGIVLAGGRSSRFGRDKLAEPVGDRPLLHHAVLALAGVCSEIVVVAQPDGPYVPLPEAMPVPLHLTTDPEPFAGPLVGLLAGLARAESSLVAVIGGDMPGIVPAVVRRMLRRMEGSTGTGGRRSGYWDHQAVVLESAGVQEPLPLVLDRLAALAAGTDLVVSGSRSLRSLISVLDVAVVPESEWRELDPGAGTVRDVDEPRDLEAL